MRLAAIDTGTNSTRLLITEILPVKRHYNKNMTETIQEKLVSGDIIREMHITRLGGNLSKTGLIDKKNAEKTASVLKKYLDLINYYKVLRYRAVGTRALRQAANAAWFKGYVADLLGLELEIISPGEEALLSFTGAAGQLKTGGEVLVMDIGGGSTEFITGSLLKGVTFTESINIGSVNISENFIKASLPGPEELIKMAEFIREKIKGIMQELRQKQFKKVIGLAGTVSALASVDLKLQKYDMERLNGYNLEFKNILSIQEKFCSLNLEDRKKITGLEPARADIIIGGTAILIEIMKGLKLRHITVSENDILDGIIYSIL